MNAAIATITQTIIERSRKTRQAYLDMIDNMQNQYPPRRTLSCGNVAHGCAANSAEEKTRLQDENYPNIAIVTAYNDMLSAHQPLADYPALIKEIAFRHGATAQVAGGVPAMCDGITQGQPGMELSLFSRDVVAMATAVALSHNTFDAAMCLGICDKIVPGLMIGALQFGHLPFVFVPAGPMPSGISNKEKASVRQQYAQGIVGKDTLLATEMASYHSPGTCTFYGTANTNQALMEALGVQLSGTSFINPDTELRKALTIEATLKVLQATPQKGNYLPLKDVVTEKSIVNAIVILAATGGSTNLTIHLITIARAAGILINWHDMDAISKATPLLARIYPNGEADVNHFDQAGGLAFVVSELRKAGLLNEDVKTIMGEGLDAYTRKPYLDDKKQLQWSEPVTRLGDVNILSRADAPFASEGGLRVMHGNLGTGLVKISAVADEHRMVEAPCRVFNTQHDLKDAFEKGELDCDHVSVVRFQGPSMNGMPELHTMTPLLGVLQDKGYKVALVTDGRMSGASGKVLSAIHVSPEAKNQGLLAYVQDGDVIRVDANSGEITLLVDESELAKRPAAAVPEESEILGLGMFSSLRKIIGAATDGGSVFDFNA
jgi:phosphogluconate dehydratase